MVAFPLLSNNNNDNTHRAPCSGRQYRSPPLRAFRHSLKQIRMAAATPIQLVGQKGDSTWDDDAQTVLSSEASQSLQGYDLGTEDQDDNDNNTVFGLEEEQTLHMPPPSIAFGHAHVWNHDHYQEPDDEYDATDIRHHNNLLLSHNDQQQQHAPAAVWMSFLRRPQPLCTDHLNATHRRWSAEQVHDALLSNDQSFRRLKRSLKLQGATTNSLLQQQLHQLVAAAHHRDDPQLERPRDDESKEQH